MRIINIVSLFTFVFIYFHSQITAQPLSQILAEQEVDTMLYNGSKDNRINWVIQNRGDAFIDKNDFTTLYENDLLKTFELGHDLEQVPYAQYRNFFNLYTYWWENVPNEDDWSFWMIKELRDTVFLPWANDETGWATFFSSTKYGGGGGAGLERDRRVGDGKMYGMGWETFLHEFGHTMPGLLDEYSADGSWSNGQCWETPNTTGALHIDDIPWRRWIEDGTPIPTPYTAEYLDKFGAFEGAMTNYFGCHRPTARGCFMGAGGFGEDYGLDLCSPCIQRVICFLYRYVNVIENPLPADDNLIVTGTETISFSADVVKPEPNTQKYQWILNGKVIAEDVETIDVTFDACSEYELIFAVHDTNILVRYDPKFEEIYPKPYREKVWYINQSDVPSYFLASNEMIQDADCTGASNGIVEFDITGGQAPYSVYLNSEAVNNPVDNLAKGTYEFDIVDANGCRVSRNITIENDALLDPQICSEWDGDAWTLWVEDANYDVNDLNILWSTSDITSSISNLIDGDYSVEVATNSGCIIQKSINLTSVENILAVYETVIPTELNQPTGKVYLDIQNGRPPYSIEWSERLNRDLTDTDVANIISSGTTWDHYPEYAFDDALNTKWLHAIPTNAFIGYQFLSPTLINYYAITSADDVPARDPRNWEFQASNDGNSWITLDEQTNHEFDTRYERRGFVFDNTTAYTYYRLFVLENYGDIATQIQELEIIGTNDSEDFMINELARDKSHRTQLAAGTYQYWIKDANLTAYSNTLNIGYAESFNALDLVVVQDGYCQVRIEVPNPDFEYYWFSDIDASVILNIGNTFQPKVSGNYYVSALNKITGAMSSNLKGFAVTVQTIPEVEVLSDTELGIINPNPDLNYYWYDEENCGTPIHIGTTFSPPEAGIYYAAVQILDDSPNPIDPTSIAGLIIRMDASDLNGDGAVDNPQVPTGSLYNWEFTNGNYWSNGSWFALRSNYQNGLGVADFATIWLQRIENGETGYQTILMAYEENPITFPERAPFEGLSQNIPKHLDASQIYSDSAPNTTLDGTTYLNGKVVDPLTTPNPLEFCILGTVMTEKSFNEVFYTDTQWEGKVGEILLYDKALSQTEMEGASEYLRKKWISVADLESPRKVLNWDGMTLDVEDESSDKKEVFLFPNPTNNQFQIKGLRGDYSVQIINASGAVLKSFNNNLNKVNIDIQDLSSGLYFVKMTKSDNSEVIVHKILKI